MTKQEIFDRVKEIALGQFPDKAERIEEMTLGSSLAEGPDDTLGFDSLDMVEFTLKIEDVFGVDFDQDEIDRVEAMGYVGGYINLLEKHLAEK